MPKPLMAGSPSGEIGIGTIVARVMLQILVENKKV